MDSSDAQLEFLKRAVWLLNRQPYEADGILAKSTEAAEADEVLVQRIMASYERATRVFEPTESFWDQSFSAIKRDIHDVLLSGSVPTAAELLRDPAETALYWGFDGPTKPPGDAFWPEAERPRDPHAFVLHNVTGTVAWEAHYGNWLKDSLFSVGEAMGILRVDYPEINVSMPRPSANMTTDGVVDMMDAFLGVDVPFPNPFAGEQGLASRRGAISFRAIQALYQAWRIRSLSNGKKDFKVLEIGAGLGRTAYYSHVLGVPHYTILDIPLTNIAQANFLGRVLVPEKTAFYGEPQTAPITVLPSFALSDLSNSFDLIVNVDSFTEMTRQAMQEYYDFARSSRTPILSINHEYNPHSFRSVYEADPLVIVSRYPYWPRRGYVEEIVRWKDA